MKTLIAFVLIVMAWPAMADDTVPTDGLAPYQPYRTALIAHGWQPENLPNAYIDTLPEVLCGIGLCTASWDSPEGEEIDFTLWRNEAGDLVLAPAWTN